MAMNIKKQPTKIIKPSVPTPANHRRYKTGFMDELAPPINVSVVLFFSPNNNHDPNFVTRLEQSLAKTLTRFYPLAGRYIDEICTVDCNDEGAEFTDAKVNLKLQDLLAKDQVKHVKFVDTLIPSCVTGEANPLLAIQATTFECGGVAVGVSVAHKIFDASSLCTFISEWASINREQNDHLELTGPSLISASLFPGRGFKPVPVPFISDDDMSSKYIRKIYSFSESAISNMKAKANHHRWSKVQLVSAIIWKAHIGVHRANNYPKGSTLLHAVSLRGKTASLIPKNSCGNLWGFCATKAMTTETTEELVDRLTVDVKKIKNNLSKVDYNTEEGQMGVLNAFTPPQESSNVVTLTSWCGFPFYEVDYGFGKPTWVVPGCVPIVSSSCLIDDAQGNGVEAHVLLEAKDVPYFDKALQVNSFAA